MAFLDTQDPTQDLRLLPKLPIAEAPVAAGAPQAEQHPFPQVAIPARATADPTGQQPVPAAPPSPMPRATLPGAQRNSQELDRLEKTGSGISQIHNPFLRALGTVGDVIASGVFPNFGTFIPGTTAHHVILTNQAANAVKRDTEQENAASEQALRGAQQAEAEGRVPLEAAQTQEALTRAKQGKDVTPHTITTAAGIKQFNPESGRFDIDVGEAPIKESEVGKTVTTDQGVMQLNPQTGHYDIEVGKAPGAKGGTVHELEDGSMIVAHPDGTATPVTVNGQPVKGKQAATNDTEIIKKQVAGKPHNVMVKKGTGEVVADLGEVGKEPTEAGEGTWSIQEGQDGKPVLFNSKTAQTRPVSGVQKPGTAEKEAGPRDALNYGQQYLAGGNFTGPGDEALMEKFFELAKPSTGFRMTQNQQEMLMHTRDLVQGLGARAKHALSPNAPYFDDTQRKNIVSTMNDLARAKGLHGENEGGAPSRHTATDAHGNKVQFDGKSWVPVKK